MALMIQNAQVAELVDAHVSGACAARRAGSSPVLGTLFYSAYYVCWRGGGIGRRATLRGSVNCDVGVRVSSSSHIFLRMRK